MRSRSLDNASDATRRVLPDYFHSTRPVAGLTHGFYRYPATTSPELVRELLLANSTVDDYVLDPFMGGGTTIVEALAHGRRAIGSDINSLATFVTRVKTTPLRQREWEGIRSWVREDPLERGIPARYLHPPPNLPSVLAMPIARALVRAQLLPTARQEALVRCALLRIAQWALESSYLYPRRDGLRNVTPSLGNLKKKLIEVLAGMEEGMAELVDRAQEHAVPRDAIPSRRLLIKSAAETLLPRRRLSPLEGKVRLVITSPPYPGVHVLYHRWQIRGRQETPAPYWIAGQNDGMVFSYYTMGGRTKKGLDRYFARLEEAFQVIRSLLHPDSAVLQLVAFNRAEEQLPLYLRAMERAGYRHVSSKDGTALVRQVPNRRWYSRDKSLDAAQEYLLFHVPRRGL